MAIVLIHGLFGWGEERPLFGLGPTYFPLQHLRKLWRDGPVVAVDVGIADSDHNRACEAFAQILGLRVDYGENHEEQSPRYGTIYESGLLDLWDAEHPVHLVGHSFGGNTAVTLFHMIAEDYWNSPGGRLEKKDQPPTSSTTVGLWSGTPGDPTAFADIIEAIGLHPHGPVAGSPGEAFKPELS